MLSNVTPHRGEHDPILEILASMNGKKNELVCHQQGYYELAHWSFEHSIVEKVETFAQIPEDIPTYGVCDSIKQFDELFGQKLRDLPKKYVVSFCKITKASQPPDGGWRWHKWGDYVGTQNPQHEYLYDEENINEVYTFHVYEIL